MISINAHPVLYNLKSTSYQVYNYARDIGQTRDSNQHLKLQLGMDSIYVKKAYADFAEGQIHYRYTTSPGRKNPIVFLHKSAPSSASCSILQQPYMERDYSTYAQDLPDVGQPLDPFSGNTLTLAWNCNVLLSFFSAI